jgi:hypothetical protein
MSATEKTISGLISSQLPDFIRADHPQFQRFVELYYAWLENNSTTGISNTAGNTIYHAMNLEKYRDIDETPDEFLTYFKEQLLPYFPEQTTLDIKKILKGAREYYSKRGSEESLKWLFKALYGVEIEVTYPKEQILIASDGKWKKPRAFRIEVGESNKNIDVNLLEKRKVTGTESGATCFVESANRSVDETNGREVIEIYISNITKYFNNGEFIEILYDDENGVPRIFRERIIGTLSNIRVDSNRRTDPSQRRRGLLYNVGDPVVITGGLGTSAEANDAAAFVGNVTRGSIESVTPTFLGYGYREYHNTQIVVLRTIGVDDDDSNSSTDLRVLALNTTACTANSQRNFLEQIVYDKTVIEFTEDTALSSSNFEAMTIKNYNVLLNVTEDDHTDYFDNFEQVYWSNTSTTNQFDSIFVGKIGTPNGQTAISGTVNVYSANGTVWGSNTLFLYELAAGQTLRVDAEDRTISSITNNEHLVVNSGYSSDLTDESALRVGPFGAYVSAATDDILIYDVDNTAPITVMTGEAGELVAVNSGKVWTINSITDDSIDANINSMMVQALDYTIANTGGLSAITVINGGFGFRVEPPIQISTHYDTDLSEDYNYNTQEELKLATWQTFQDLGKIAHIHINSGGTGYAVGDGLLFVGRGYGSNGYVQSITANGSISSIVLDDRGEGHLVRPEVYVDRSSVSYDTLTGTATVNNESNVVTGVSTSFLENLTPLNVIKINNEVRKIAEVVNNTILIVNTAFTANATLQSISKQIGDEASLTAYLVGDGFEETVDTSAIGRIQDIRLLYRGYDYVSTPTVSLKVVDTIVFPLPEEQEVYEQEYVYQGLSFGTSTFRANVKSYSRSTNLLRLYNYSGSIDINQPLRSANDVIISINGAARVPVPVRGVLVGTGPTTFYPPSVADLPNPMYYGNGRAKANALFANGLIEFNGFFLNTDGFPSADKVLQDDDLYHNFSYVIQAEKDLIEYETTVKNIAHPTGMQLFAKRISESTDNVAIVSQANVDVLLSTYDSSRVTISNSRSNVVTGYGTDFTNSIGGGEANTTVNVGDLFIISYSQPYSELTIGNDPSLRTQTKLITRVNSNTELEVESDFIIVGQGRAKSNVLYADITGTVNTNPAVTGTVNINSKLTGTVNVNDRITGTVNVLASNVLIGNNTSFLSNLVANSIITVNNQKKLVVSVTNNQHLIVNSAFTYAGNDNIAYLTNTVIFGTGTTFTSDLTVGDIVTINGETRNVVSVVNNTRLDVDAPFTNHANTQDIYPRTNVVIGTGTNFDPQINVGDLITINNETRQVTLVTDDETLEVNTVFINQATDVLLYKENAAILGVGTSFTTELQANDVIKVNNQIREVLTVESDTLLSVNAPFTYFGTSNTISKLSNTILTISGNTNSLSEIIVAGDNISFNIASSNVYKQKSGTIKVFTTNTAVVGTSTSFDTEMQEGDFIKVNGDIRQIVSIEDATHLNVSSAFTANLDGNLIYRRETTQNSNVVAVSGNTITLNVAIEANTNNMVWLTVPNYSLPITLTGTVNVTGTDLYVIGNTTSPNITYFVGNVTVGMEINVNNEIRLVTAVTDNSNLTVNASFNTAAVDKYANTQTSYSYRIVTLTKDLG